MPLWQEYLKLLRRFQGKRRKYRRYRRATKNRAKTWFGAQHGRNFRKAIRRRYKRYRRKGY